MNFKNWLYESQRGEIARMQPDSVITVFHGTDAETAYDFCLNGIDAKKQQRYRIYPHFSNGKPIKFGLFVAPDLKTSQKFGNVVLKFSTLAKNLIYRFPTEMKNTSDYWKSRYPQSFRPLVSWDLLDKGVEPQALFIGLLSPRAIQKVYYYKNPGITREEYIENYQNNTINAGLKIKKFKGPFEPQEYKISLTDFVKRMAQEYGGTEAEILDTLKYVYKRQGYLDGIGYVPPTLLKRIEKQLAKIV